jgi:serine/threonine protein kinase
MARDEAWYRGLKGLHAGRYVLAEFVGAGKIGYVYRADREDLPDHPWAVKLAFDTLKTGWEEEIKKVAKLQLIDGVVHFHDSGAATLNHGGVSHLAQYTVWDYIPPGENLRHYLSRVIQVPTTFVVAVLDHVLRILHACETQGVARHGDLHSKNILIGEPSSAKLDDMLQPRAPIYVSDFGYGATGGVKQPKDDYEGLANIFNEMLAHVEYSISSATDKRILRETKEALTKLLREPAAMERKPPIGCERSPRRRRAVMPPHNLYSTARVWGPFRWQR